MKRVIRIVLDIVIAVCVVGILVGAVRFGIHFYNKSKTEEMYQQISEEARVSAAAKPAEEHGNLNAENDVSNDEIEEKYQSPIDFEMLWEINTEIVAWIEIKDTQIDYPVLFFDGNESYYVNHDFYKNRTDHGSIFFGKESGIQDSAKYYRIIYGHHMMDGTMFADLIKYRDKKFTEEHSKITLYWGDSQTDYQVVAVFTSDVSADLQDGFYYSEHLERNHFNYTYMKTEISKRQLFTLETDWTEEDELLLLSTCEYSTPNGRLVVVAKALNEESGQ